MKICITSKVLYTFDAKIDSRFINSIVRHSMCNRVSFLKYMHSIKQRLHVLLIFFTGILLEFFHSITNLSLQENYYMQRSWFLSKLSLLNAKLHGFQSSLSIVQYILFSSEHSEQDESSHWLGLTSAPTERV